MSLALLERLRKALFALAALLALWAAWVAGRNFRPPSLPPEAVARLDKAFPAPKTVREVHRSDREIQYFHAMLPPERHLVPEAPTVEVASGPPPFKLVGTSYNAASPQDSSAMVMNSKGSIRSYRVGQVVEVDEAKLLSVCPPKARFLWQGREVELGPDSPRSPVVIPGPPTGQTQFTIPPKEWAHYFEHVADYWNMVKVDANIVGGKKDGLRINFMDEKFPGRKYGLQEGDVVYKVNGGSLTNPMEMFGLFNSMKEPKPVSIEVERGGRRFTLTIRPEEPVPPKK